MVLIVSRRRSPQVINFSSGVVELLRWTKPPHVVW